MKSPLMDIERLAINLSVEDRAKLVIYLLDSLQSVADAERARDIDARLQKNARATPRTIEDWFFRSAT